MILNMIGNNTGIKNQQISSTFTTNSSGAASVNCGFKPDAIVIKVFTSTTYDYECATIFFESTNKKVLLAYSPSYEVVLRFIVQQTNSGFDVSNVSYDNATLLSNAQFNYVALKYS